MININHLRSFYICALHKNVTKAAKVLHVSQPSVSQQIKSFEDELGFPLFFRNGRSLDLTSEGKILFQKSKLVYESVLGIEDFIERRSDFSGMIKVFACDEIEKPFLARIAAELMKSPSLHRASFVINSMSNIEEHRSNERNTTELYLSHKKLKGLALVQEFVFPVKLISNIQNIEMGQVKTSHLNSLLLRLGQRLLIPSRDHKLRLEIDRHIKIDTINKHILLESNVMACLTQSVREGLGCSLLPLQYVYDDVKKNRLSVYGPPNGFWGHYLYLYSAKEKSDRAAKELVRIIQKFSIEKGG
ncbi:MAG TPA: LysR family transcriptional regulator [Pseudobdellovibrionaceae bacterium]|nr:LysR family transcriptional regulator [Pseudobdellovibrionaceae bacterium]